MSIHAIATLKLSRRVADVSAFAQSVFNAMNKNPAFPAPTPLLATIEADVTALEVAEAIAITKSKGAAEARNAKLATLEADLEYLRAYVQQVADASTNPVAVIESAGMSVRKSGARLKGELTARPGEVSGSVDLFAKAVAASAAYEWQYSIDQKTWTPAPLTLQAKTTVAGLTPAVSYFFRFRPTTRTGTGNWSQVASLLVT